MFKVQTVQGQGSRHQSRWKVELLALTPRLLAYLPFSGRLLAWPFRPNDLTLLVLKKATMANMASINKYGFRQRKQRAVIKDLPLKLL